MIRPLNLPTTSQNSRSILNWLLDKARVSEDGSRFSGYLSHEAVGELVKVIKALPQVERSEQHGEDGTIYHYEFMMVHTIKGEFSISVQSPKGRRAGDKYQVNLDYRAVSLEELLRLYERGIK